MSNDKKNRILQDIVTLKNKTSSSFLIEAEESMTNKKEQQKYQSPLVYGAMTNQSNATKPSETQKENKKEEKGSSSLIPPFLKKKTSKSDPAKPEQKEEGEGENKKTGLNSGTPFPDPAEVPTQKGDFGITYDFNLGVRFYLPAGEKWRARMIDLDTQTMIYTVDGEDIHVASRKRHYMRVRIEVERQGKVVWVHDYDAKNKNVAVIFPAGTVGDTLGWFPYAYRFAQTHGCRLHVVMSKHMKELMEPVYPDVVFHIKEEFEKDKELLKSFYATYYMGLFFHDKENIWQPSDFRMVGLHRTAGHILGVNPQEEPPRVYIEKENERPIEEPYVVVAVQASSACKLWNNPNGWLETVEYLRSVGYRVICIDLNPVIGHISSWNALPYGVEDETGQRPLSERARWLKHADFFVGLSSGLSWLAWAVGTPVVMISGFTHPSNEFVNPYRVFSTHVCNSCWHDVAHPFKHDDYLFCPHHKDTNRHFECTRAISSAYVVDVIKRLCEDYAFLPLKNRNKEVKKPKKSKAKITGEKKT